MVDNILLLPHCDLHMVVGQEPKLALRLMRQTDHPDPTVARYLLTPVARTQYEIDWFRPYDPPGHRLDDKPTLVPVPGDPATSQVTQATPGIYLFQIRLGTQYLVGRLQVHRQVLGWWFGNDSITTAKDSVAHAQPSLYAEFGDDHDTGVDVVGDITGHGYVTLASTDENTFKVTPEGRLLGLNETSDPNHLPSVTGTWPALGNKDTPARISVQVVNYNATRPILEAVRSTGVKGHAAKHNIIFLAEGFREKDRSRFTSLVQQATDEIFTKPRHEPYHLLERNFNVFKAFTPSTQHTLTCGFTLMEAENNDEVPKGTPLPVENALGGTGTYPMNQLIGLAGLPRRNEPEDAGAILNQWITQGLPGPGPLDLDLNRVDDTLIKQWRVHRADGILNARDTFFGLHTGGRLADRLSQVSNPVLPVDQPGNPDDPGEKATRAFMHRLYEFYRPQNPGMIAVHLDRRRHPPELYSFFNETNPNTSVVQYLGGLQYPAQPPDPALPIGQEWVPDDTVFQRSRGLVVILVLDDHDMGQNINNRSLTALSATNQPTLSFHHTPHREMKRTPPENIEPSVDEIIDTVAHELGHSFNLDDEYELDGGKDSNEIDGTRDVDADNVTHFNFVTANDPQHPDDIDPDKVKWLAVPRTFLSSRLTGDSQVVDGRFQVPIDPNDVGQWMHARTAFPGLQVALRSIAFTAPPTKQLPQSGLLLSPLTIVDVVQAGAVVVAGPGIPPAKPVPAGSLLWVPLGDKAGGPPLLAADPVVQEFLRDTHEPLNRDTDTKDRNLDTDKPRLIRGFQPPCKSFRVIGVYEGARRFAAHYYRPAGGCKMRNQSGSGRGGEFCFICKWLIVNRVDPGMHALLTDRFYPNAKSSNDG